MKETKRWEVHGWRPDGEFGPLAEGPGSSFPKASERESMLEAGCEIYVDGKLYVEDNGKKTEDEVKEKPKRARRK